MLMIISEKLRQFVVWTAPPCLVQLVWWGIKYNYINDNDISFPRMDLAVRARRCVACVEFSMTCPIPWELGSGHCLDNSKDDIKYIP